MSRRNPVLIFSRPSPSAALALARSYSRGSDHWAIQDTVHPQAPNLTAASQLTMTTTEDRPFNLAILAWSLTLPTMSGTMTEASGRTVVSVDENTWLDSDRMLLDLGLGERIV